MAQAKDVFSKSSDSVATTATIFTVAQTQGVVIQEILSSGASSQMLEGITYTVLPVEIKVTGNVNALITFITALNQELGTGVIQTAVLNALPNAVITVNTPGPTPKPDSGGVAPSTADIQMSIYTYRGN
jgi:hypothetical protein